MLLKELELYDSEMLKKKMILAVSKSDLLDEELMNEMKRELPENIPSVFISSVTGFGIQELKDLIWQELQQIKR
jgi:GTP-binding protein